MDPQLAQHQRRFEADPDAKDSFAALEEHYFMAEEWDALVALYERRLSAPTLIDQSGAQADLLVRQGRILEERCDDADGSIERYLGAIRLQPDCRAALGRLRRLYVGREAWGSMFSLAETEAELPLKHHERASLLSEIGLVCLDRVRDVTRARGYLERALGEVPEHREALAGLARVFEQLDEPAEALGVLVRLGQQTKGTERARALQQAGHLSANRLGQRERASQLFRAALDADPSLQAAREGLARLEIAQEEETREAEILEAEARDEGAADPEVQPLVGEPSGDGPGPEEEIELAESLGPPDREFEAAQRSEARLETATLAAAQGDDSEAIATLEEALQQNPKHIESLELLASLLVRSERFEDAIDVLERLSDSACDPSRRGAVLTCMGSWLEQHLDDPVGARAAYERALQADPSLVEPFAALCQLHQKTEHWRELRSMLEGFRRFGTPERRVQVTLQLGELLDERFDDVAGAVSAFQEALELDPEETRAREALARLGSDLPPEERRIHRTTAQARSAADPGRRLELVRQLVPLLEQAGRPEEALEWAQRIASESDGDRETFETIARLQETLGLEGELRETLEKLDPFLVESDRVGNRARMAELHWTLGQREQALAAYRSALEIEPNDRRVLEALIPLLKEAERFLELAKVQETLAGILDSPEREACLDQLAALTIDRLEDLEAGIRILQQLESEPSPPPDLGPRLEALLSRAGHFEDLVQRLARRRAALDPDLPQTLELAREEARIRAEHLGQWSEAADALLAAGSGAFDHPEGLAELEQYVRAAQDDTMLVEVLVERAARAVDSASRFRIDAERARILEGFPERRDEARDAYRDLLLQHPDEDTRTDLLHRLGAVLEQSEDWAGLREVLDAQLELAPPQLAAQLHERLGWLCTTHLREAAAAIVHFEELASSRPDATGAWQQLATLYAEHQKPRDERRVLEGWLAAEPGTAQARELHARMARLCSRLDDADAAFEHHAVVFDLDPSDAEASEFLVEAHQRNGRVVETVKVLESRLAALGEAVDAGAQAAANLVRLRIAEQRADALDDLAGAIGVLEPAAVDGPEFECYAEPLGMLYQRAGRLGELIELSKRVIRSSSAPGARARWQLRIAEAARTRGLEEDAIEAYRLALALRPSDPRIESALAELYRAGGKPGPLVEVLEASLMRLGGAPAVPLHLECAGLLDERLARSGPALDHVRRALNIDPGSSDAIRLGLGIASGIGDVSVELEFLDLALASAMPAPDRCVWLVRRGELRLAEGAAEAAVESWREALTLDPRQAELRVRIREQLEKLGRVDEALRWLAAEADQSRGEASAALCEQGVELAVRTGGPEAGLPWLEQLCRLRPLDASLRVRLADLNQQLGRHAAALRALETQASLALDDEVPAIELRRARIYQEHLRLPARAIECLEAARAVAPHEIRVLRDLEGLYARAGRHRARADVLETLLASTEPGARLEWMRELAELWGGPLANPERAAGHLREALRQTEEGAPGVPTLLAQLRGFLVATGGQFEWAEVAERELRARLAESGGGSENQVCRTLRLELARAYECELCRPDLALPHWESLVDAKAPATAEASEEAEAALLRLLRSQGRLVELEGRLSARVERGVGGTAAASELASLRERLHLVPEAAAAWHRVRELDPGSIEGVRGGQRTADRLADWSELARWVERELELAGNASAPERAALLGRLAELRLHRLGDSQGARSALEAIIALGEGDPETFCTLETLLESMQAWEAVVDVYHGEIGVLEQEDPARRGELWRRIAQIEGRHNDAPEAALEALRQVDALDPLSAELLRARAELELALGDKEAYAQTQARWCDDPGSGCAAADHLALARFLDELGRRGDAAARIEPAVSLDTADREVWVLAARLRERNDDPAGASRAYLRAADASGGDEAALFLGQAAALIEDADLAGACDLLDRAIHVSRRSIPALHAQRVAAATELGRHADVLASALCIHEVARTQDDVPERDELLNLFVAGARSAWTLERAEDAARLWGAVRELEPDHGEALVGSAEALFTLESWVPARETLEHLLALPGREAERARDLGRLGIALERLQAPSEAADRYRLALDLDPSLEVADGGLIRALQDAGRMTECLDALLDRADQPAFASLRADRLLRAAQIAIELGRSQEACQHLRTVREARPDDPRPWLRSVQLLAETGDSEAADAVASQGLERLEDPEARAELALGRGRRLEARGQTRAAADLYLLAAELDANQVPAALGAARTLRSLGEPERASEILSDFLAAFPSADAVASAPVWLAAGDLRAGPIDDPQGAAEAYRRALELAPDLTAARDALAVLLVRMPECREESVSLHAQILAERPTDLASLRALLALAEGGDDAGAVANGLAILTGLGAASPEERERSDGRLRLTVSGASRFEDVLWDGARRLLAAGSKAVDRVLDSAIPMEAKPEDPADRFRRAARDAESAMTTAGCAALDDGELRDLVVALAELASGSNSPSTDRVWAASLSDAIGSFARRRLKRALAPNSPSEIAGIDFSAWRGELRRMARARALDATGGELRAALVAVVSESRELAVRGLDPESDLSPLVGHCPASRDLMRDVALSWARSLSPGKSRKGGSHEAG